MTPETTEWLALHRAHEGGVIYLVDGYFNFGRPVGGYLAEVFDRLIRAGLLALGQPSTIGQQQVCVTHSGQVRYRELSASSTRAGTGVAPDGH